MFIYQNAEEIDHSGLTHQTKMYTVCLNSKLKGRCEMQFSAILCFWHPVAG